MHYCSIPSARRKESFCCCYCRYCAPVPRPEALRAVARDRRCQGRKLLHFSHPHRAAVAVKIASCCLSLDTLASRISISIVSSCSGRRFLSRARARARNRVDASRVRRTVSGFNERGMHSRVVQQCGTWRGFRHRRPKMKWHLEDADKISAAARRDQRRLI